MGATLKAVGAAAKNAINGTIGKNINKMTQSAIKNTFQMTEANLGTRIAGGAAEVLTNAAIGGVGGAAGGAIIGGISGAISDDETFIEGMGKGAATGLGLGALGGGAGITGWQNREHVLSIAKKISGPQLNKREAGTHNGVPLTEDDGGQLRFNL